jgi:tetratricopeptide (TPR) repeat protein
MAKGQSITLKICDWVAKYSLYAAVFLTPIFFLPWTSEVLDFNKQAMLIMLVAVSLFSWMLKVLVSGKLELNINKMHIFAGVLFVVYLLSTIFSVYRYGSFWGWPQITSESLLSLISLLLFYFLAVNIFSKKDVSTLIKILFSSAIVAELVGILQLFGLFVFQMDFSKSVSFNTLGPVGGLGFFAVILLPLSMLLLMASKKWWKLLFFAQLILSLLLLFLINYSIIWWVVIIASALVMIFGAIRRDFFDTRWMALPMFFLAVSIFFMLLSPKVKLVEQRADEVFLSQKASFQIAMQSVKQNPVLGSGPGTFAYDFSKFKDTNFNKSLVWNITFNKASSKVLNDLSTTGILGVLASLALSFFAVFYGIKYLIVTKDAKGTEKENGALYWIMLSGLLIAIATQVITSFIYNSNLVLDFLYFLMVAGVVVLISGEKKKYELKSSSLATLIMTFVFTLVFIFGLGILIINGQRYVAETNYFSALFLLQSGKTDDGIKKMEAAATQNPASDLYFRQLAQVYLFKLQSDMQDASSKALTDDDKNKVQQLVVNSVNAGKIATDINPRNVINWSVRGYIYQNLFGVVSDAGTWALTSYDEALKLDPNNPSLFAQEGNVNFILAMRTAQDQSDQRNQFLTKAKENLEKAVSLNPEYSNALYSLGLVYDALGQKDKAIEEFTLVLQLNQQNADVAANIQTILSNLKAGKSALQTATPPSEAPSENPSSDSSVKNPPADDTKSEETKTKK